MGRARVPKPAQSTRKLKRPSTHGVANPPRKLVGIIQPRCERRTKFCRGDPAAASSHNRSARHPSDYAARKNNRSGSRPKAQVQVQDDAMTDDEIPDDKTHDSKRPEPVAAVSPDTDMLEDESPGHQTPRCDEGRKSRAVNDDSFATTTSTANTTDAKMADDRTINTKLSAIPSVLAPVGESTDRPPSSSSIGTSATSPDPDSTGVFAVPDTSRQARLTGTHSAPSSDAIHESPSVSEPEEPSGTSAVQAAPEPYLRPVHSDNTANQPNTTANDTPQGGNHTCLSTTNQCIDIITPIGRITFRPAFPPSNPGSQFTPPLGHDRAVFTPGVSLDPMAQARQNLDLGSVRNGIKNLSIQGQSNGDLYTNGWDFDYTRLNEISADYPNNHLVQSYTEGGPNYRSEELNNGYVTQFGESETYPELWERLSLYPDGPDVSGSHTPLEARAIAISI